jgi:protein TonB
MFEYINPINQKRGVSRLAVVSLMTSCFLHFCMGLTLYLFPQLLAGGNLRQWRGFNWGTAATDEGMEDWRMVAILESPDRMNMPSLEALRRSLGLGDKEEGAGSPLIEVRFSPPDALETDKPPLPQVPPEIEEPEVVIPGNRGPGVDDETKPDTGSSVESPQTEPADPGLGRDILAAKPETAPKVEIAGEAVPRKIPAGIQPPAPPASSPPPEAKPAAAKPVVADETGSNSGVGFFDTGGFPMGEYRDIISELVRSKWLIPSTLINNPGIRTAVVFYIDRNGHVVDLRVDRPSGNTSFDRAALGAVLSASPFPPLPKDFPGQRVGVRFWLIYDP